MSLPKSILKYGDIARDLHAMPDGGRRVLSTPAKAQRWRMRAYMYRTLLEAQYEQGLSPFTRMIFRITKAEPSVVTILIEPESDGWIEDAAGNRIEPAAQQSPFDGPAESEIEQAVREAEYKAQVDAKLAELRAAMQRSAAPPVDPMDYEPPEKPDISPQSLEDLGL
jgi:hypothetical protein